MAQITYADKSYLNQNATVPASNKVQDTDLNEIKSAVNINTPVGCIQIYAGSTAPTGWLICDGSAVSRTTYANLFAVIGTTYGSGDGSTTFNVPNLKGTVPVGLDSSDTDFDTLGETGGSKYLQQHYHDYIKWYDQNTSADSASGQSTHRLAITANGGQASSAKNYHTGSVNTSVTTGNSGNLQPYIVMNYIISY
jgi:microcystin-dependent protein